MTRSLQICLTLVIVQWIGVAYSVPFLQGISIRRNFDISLKPLQIKPITFTREKWGPFGSYGRRHSITKREAEPDSGPKSVIPIVPKVVTGVIPPSVTVTSPSGLNNEISIPPMRHIPPAPVYENIPEGPAFLTPPSQVNTASSTLISSIVPQSTPIRNSFFQPSTSGPVSISSPPIISIPTVITPAPPGNNIPPFRFNTDITQSIPPSPFLNILNPGPVYDTPARVNLLVPNNDQPQLVNTDIPSATRRGILARFGEFFLQLLTRFFNATRLNRPNLQPPQ